MSGIEIAGLIIGSIPLILEAFDRSERTLDFFRTCGRYAKELTKLNSILGAQRSIFRNNCINLLSTVTSDPGRAHEIVAMSPTDATAWFNSAHKEYDLTLSPNMPASETLRSCRSVLLLIQQSLETITQELEGFRVDLAPALHVSQDFVNSIRQCDCLIASNKTQGALCV